MGQIVPPFPILKEILPKINLSKFQIEDLRKAWQSEVWGMKPKRLSWFSRHILGRSE